MTQTEENDEAGRRLLGGAWAYLRAAELLHADDPVGRTWPVCFVNIGFAIELGLKGYLRRKGASEDDQRRLRHDLQGIFQAVCGVGFRPSHPLMAELAIELREPFSDMSLRYLEGHSLNLPPIDQVIEVTRLLLRDLHGQSSA